MLFCNKEQILEETAEGFVSALGTKSRVGFLYFFFISLETLFDFLKCVHVLFDKYYMKIYVTAVQRQVD